MAEAEDIAHSAHLAYGRASAEDCRDGVALVEQVSMLTAAVMAVVEVLKDIEMTLRSRN